MPADYHHPNTPQFLTKYINPGGNVKQSTLGGIVAGAALLASHAAPAFALDNYPSCYVMDNARSFQLYFEGNGTIENCRLYLDAFNKLTGAPIWHMFDTTRRPFGAGLVGNDVYNSIRWQCQMSNDRGGTVLIGFDSTWPPDAYNVWCGSPLGEYHNPGVIIGPVVSRRNKYL